MPAQESLRAVGTVPLFAGLSSRERSRLAAAAQAVQVAAGTDVVSEAETGRDLFVVLEGRLVVRRRGRRAATLGPGDYFGELSLLDGAPRSATVTAETGCRLLVLGPDAFDRALAEVPELGAKLLTAMAGRLRAADRRAFSH